MKTERPLAKVYDDYLYESDLRGVVVPGTLPKDSLVISRSYIENWVRQRLMIQQAEKSLSASQMDFTKEESDWVDEIVLGCFFFGVFNSGISINC